MNTIRVSALAVTLLVIGPLQPSGPSLEAHAYVGINGDRVYTGELVVTEPGHNRFRLVGHDGSFTAPDGAMLQALDGKPVQVEFSRDGRVREITEMPIHIEPITHGMEVLSGELAVVDGATRRFTIAGDERSFVAPSGADIVRYAGHRVELRLNDYGQVTDIRPAPGAPPAAAATTCSYGGQGYSDGALLCQSASQFRCEAGTWRSLGVACAAGGATASRMARTCALGGASVADGSAICRDGTSYRCADGDWVYVGTACR